MAAAADNFVYSDYVSDDGNTYSIRTLAAFQADTANNGLTATSTHVAYGRETKRRHPRKGIYMDLTSLGRKTSIPFATVAKWNTATTSLGTTPLTFTRSVRGEAAARTYTLIATTPEKRPGHVIQGSAPQQP